jgi:transposase
MAREQRDKEGYKVRVKAVDRKQMVLCPTDVESLVSYDHEVRAIWELVGRLDLSGYYREGYA